MDKRIDWNSLVLKTYSIIDIETTGGYRNGNKIIEIAIINFNGKVIIEEFSTLINPEINIPFTITKLTGITNEMVTDAPKFFEVAKKIIEMTEGNVFVAHNVFFDFNFIKHEFSDLGYIFKRDKLCTVRLARKFLPGHGSYSLGKICSDLSISISARHRALGDALATVELLKLITSKNDFGKEDFSESKKIAIPKDVDREQFEKLPEKTGIYYFYSKDNALLYIGKSKNIKKRVSSHFRPDMKRKKDINLKNLIARIEFKLLGSELASLLFENSLIFELKPPFNTALKGSMFPVHVTLSKKTSPYSLKTSTQDLIKSEVHSFKNKKNARAFINSIYQSFLNIDEDSIEFETKKRKFINKFGEKLFNNFLLEGLNYMIPKKETFMLKLNGRSHNESCLLVVINHRPERLVFVGDQKEIIKLNSTPQMQRMLYNYIKKFKLNLIDLDNNYDNI